MKARDVNDIVVLGFGAWSDINALPTLGFGVSSVPFTAANTNRRSRRPYPLVDDRALAAPGTEDARRPQRPDDGIAWQE